MLRALSTILLIAAVADPGALAQEPTKSVFAERRAKGEEAIRARLVDPVSAQFEWPYDFLEGTWPTIFKKQTYEGIITCGFVNSKNRVGGYVGRTFFVVVMKDGAVSYADVGTPRGSDWVSRSCARSASSFAAAPKSDASAIASPSVADELRKLADLRAQGVITEAELQIQKRKLLDN